MISVTMPSVPSEPTNDAEQVGPGRVRTTASSTSSPSGSTTPTPGTWFDGEAVLEAVRAARVLGDVAADRADLLAGRVRRVVEAVRRRPPR